MTSNQVWRQKNPEKVKAHWTIQKEKRAGRLVKQPCEVCGDPRTHAHHDDYTRLLDIRWLCSAHHREHHAREKGYLLHGQRPPYIRHPITRPYCTKYHPAPKRDALLAQAQDLRERGWSYLQIGRELGVGKGVIYKWLNPKPGYK